MMSSVTGISSLFKIEPIAEGNCFIELSGKIEVAIKSDRISSFSFTGSRELYSKFSFFKHPLKPPFLVYLYLASRKLMYARF